MTARDRTGEPIDDHPAEHTCDRGWADEDTRTPCRHCRPWLVATPARPPTRAELARFTARHST